MLKLPKYIHSNVPTGPSTGDYVIRTIPPRFVGKVVTEGDLVRVILHDAWEDISPADAQKYCLEMKNWYYFKNNPSV